MQSTILGATPSVEGTYFCVWALGHQRVSVVVEAHGEYDLTPFGDGYFSADVPGVRAGARYRFRVDGGKPLPDLASRWQPDGSDGASVVIDPGFGWTDGDWRGVDRFDQVISEIHIGTFTEAGTWAAAAKRLDDLKDVGISVLHVMPVGTFKGHFGWGYDTVLPFAPFAPYGSPQDMQRFVDRAHALGIGVILDVVYNHVGAGDHFRGYSEHFFTDRYKNEWGASFNFDGEHARAVRDFIISNAVHWIRDFHIDGLRLDATQALFDARPQHIIAELTAAVRSAGGQRHTYVIGENHPQDHRLVDPLDKGGYAIDALVSDDFQHAARVAMTGHNDFYYRDYLGKPQELLSALKYGFLYQGQRSDMREKPYGTYNLDTPPERFVHFLENHDQIANSARGFRLSTLATPARLRAFSSLLLLGPQTPCLFQGQEWAAGNPFVYFLGLDGEEAEQVAKGRRESLTNFISVADPSLQAQLPDPAADSSFTGSKLNWTERERNRGMVAFHRDLLQRRRDDPAFSQRGNRRIDGAVIGEAAILLRFFTEDTEGHRLLMVNWGRDLHVGVIAEPLLAPPDGTKWVRSWSSEDPVYDGAGRPALDTDQFWMLTADSAVLLSPEPRT